MKPLRKTITTWALLALLAPACTEQKEEIRTNVEQQTAHAQARKGGEVLPQTPKEVLSSLLVYLVKKDGEAVEIRSGQAAFPILKYRSVEATAEGKVYTFSTEEKWYRVCLSADAEIESSLRTASTEAGLSEPGHYQEETFFEGEITSYDIDDKIPTTVFFEELIYGLALLDNRRFEVPRPAVVAGQCRAVCRGQNVELVTRGLAAVASADGDGAYTPMSEAVRFSGGRGSMRYALNR